MSERVWKVLKILLLIGSVLAAVKLVFVDYTLDEEYQYVMAYRTIAGDTMYRQIWEPHQSSAFLCTGLMRLYMAVAGTNTGVILFMRLFSLGVQSLLAWAVYRTFLHLTEKNYAFLLALIYFNILPKNIQGPEFSNMQLWFLTISLLLMMKYYREYEQEKGRKLYLVVLAGVSLACELLVYPTCVILFPFFLVYIWVCSKKTRWRDCLTMAGTCGVCGGLWLAAILSKVSVQEFIRTVRDIFASDLTHDVSGMTDGKWVTVLDNFVMWAGLTAVTAVCAGILLLGVQLVKRKRDRADCETDRQDKTVLLKFLVLAVLVAEVIQVYFWVFRNAGYEYPQIHLFIIWLATAAAWRCGGQQKKVLVWPIAGTLVAYAAVMYISDLALFYALPHGVLGIVCCVLLLVQALEGRLKEKAAGWAYLLLVGLCVCSIFGKGYTLRAGMGDNTIWAVGGVMKEGPAAGILSDYMCAYIYNCNYEDYHAYVEDGDKVLIVANMVMSVGTTAYMFQDVDICHFSVIDPTSYDERLGAYWEKYPEKRPNVIVVDCWYGELKESSDSWIMQYIENDFGYTSVEDGRYVRFYRK